MNESMKQSTSIRRSSAGRAWQGGCRPGCIPWERRCKRSWPLAWMNKKKTLLNKRWNKCISNQAESYHYSGKKWRISAYMWGSLSAGTNLFLSECRRWFLTISASAVVGEKAGCFAGTWLFCLFFFFFSLLVLPVIAYDSMKAEAIQILCTSHKAWDIVQWYCVCCYFSEGT